MGVRELDEDVVTGVPGGRIRSHLEGVAQEDVAEGAREVQADLLQSRDLGDLEGLGAAGVQAVRGSEELKFDRVHPSAFGVRELIEANGDGAVGVAFAEDREVVDCYYVLGAADDGASSGGLEPSEDAGGAGEVGLRWQGDSEVGVPRDDGAVDELEGERVQGAAHLRTRSQRDQCEGLGLEGAGVEAEVAFLDQEGAVENEHREEVAIGTVGQPHASQCKGYGGGLGEVGGEAGVDGDDVVWVRRAYRLCRRSSRWGAAGRSSRELRGPV